MTFASLQAPISGHIARRILTDCLHVSLCFKLQVISKYRCNCTVSYGFFFSYHFMFALLLLQFFGALFFTNQFKIVNRSSLLLWEVISASESLRELAKGWSCWNPGLWLAFPTLLFCCCGSCKAFTALGLVRVEFQTSAVLDLLS